MGWRWKGQSPRRVLKKWGAAAHRGVRLPSVGGLAEGPEGSSDPRGARLRVPDKVGRRMRCQSIGEEF